MKKKVATEIQALEQKLSAKTGPRGGKIIGETSSGKPIYEKAPHSSHKEFSGKDHQEAYAAHYTLGNRARSNGDESKAQHHFQQQDHHKHKMQAHESLGEKLRSFDQAHSKVKLHAASAKTADFGYGENISISKHGWGEIKKAILQSHKASPYKKVTVSPMKDKMKFGANEGGGYADAYVDIDVQFDSDADPSLHSVTARVTARLQNTGDVILVVQTRYNQA